MADFRRWILALAVLALCAGLASAQTGGTGGLAFTCSANTSNIPTLRSEGLTEQIGDIVITCLGGNPTDGAAGQKVNITVAMQGNDPITTRLENAGGVSDALLMIDEPTTGCPPNATTTPTAACAGTGPIADFGSNANLIACPNPTTGGCSAYGYHVFGGDGNVYVIQTAATVGTAIAGDPSVIPAGTTQAPNVYQGVVNGTQVTFFGVPIIAPGSNGERVYRITNIRITPAATGSVSAFVVSSNPAALPISQGNPIVGFVSPSLTTAATPITNLPQCVNQTLTFVGLLSFKEAGTFASAFKTRSDPNVAGQSATSPGITTGQGQLPLQDVPGTIYNSESGFTPGAITGLTQATGNTIGLADFGTRFHAIFSSLPAGATLYVSLHSVALNGLGNAPVGDSATTGSYALMVTSDTAAEGSFTTPGLTSVTPSGGTAIELVPINSTASPTSGAATWEVVTTNPTQIDTYNFAVYISYTATPGSNLPTAGVPGLAALGYAPSSTADPTSTNIPRFGPDGTPTSVVQINPCQTVLLFPYVTDLSGFNTGIAISNTSTDPFNTIPQAGTCTVKWYGNISVSDTVSPNPIGLSSSSKNPIWAFDIDTYAPGFEGYLIALCHFQYAHGLAFITDLGTRNVATTYLALVIPDPSLNANTRPPAPFPCIPGSANCGGTTNGEQLGN